MCVRSGAGVSVTVRGIVMTPAEIAAGTWGARVRSEAVELDAAGKPADSRDGNECGGE